MDLSFLGLSKNETSLYLALLKLGEAKASELSLATGLDRASVYDIADSLMRKNLLSRQERGKIFSFTAHNPRNILLSLRQKEQTFQELLPDLLQEFKTKGKSPSVRVHQGDEALVGMYESILDTRGLKSYDIISSEQDWLQMNPRYLAKFKKRRADRGIRTRLILETSSTAQKRKSEDETTLSQSKILPPAFSPLSFSGGCYIFADRVIFVAYREEHLATEIFSAEIAAFMQNIFDMLWKTIA